MMKVKIPIKTPQAKAWACREDEGVDANQKHRK
jgi:hypothetical protein